MPRLFESPHIGGPFNDWHWEGMINVVDFCMQHDPNPPNFVEELINQKVIRSSVSAENDFEMNEHE